MEKRFSDYKVVKKVKSHHFDYYILVDKENKKYFAKQLFILEEKYLMNIKNEIVKLKMLKNYGIFPNIVDYDADHNHYIIYDYIEGKTLNYLKNLSVKTYIDIIILISNHLEILHNHNIVHCDIKPNNIMIDQHGKLYIIDFENSKLIGEKTIFGTKVYCSIEQLKKEKVSVQFDIYSLGILMYELLTGEKAYHERNMIELIQAKQNKKLSICAKNSQIPNIIDCILYKAIRYDGNYYNNISEMRNDLYQLRSLIQ